MLRLAAGACPGDPWEQGNFNCSILTDAVWQAADIYADGNIPSDKGNLADNWICPVSIPRFDDYAPGTDDPDEGYPHELPWSLYLEIDRDYPAFTGGFADVEFCRRASRNSVAIRHPKTGHPVEDLAGSRLVRCALCTALLTHGSLFITIIGSADAALRAGR